MSYSSLFNNPNYANIFNQTTYSLVNLHASAVNTLENVPANNGTTVTYINVLRLSAGGNNRILIPAGTYNLSMKVRININDTAPSNLTYGALVVYDASDPIYTDGTSIRLLVSSSISFVQSVNSTLTYANINETQRIVFTTDTYLSMIFEYCNSVGLHKIITGILPTDNIDYTPSITLKPTF
jgi:hypothetical protein